MNRHLAADGLDVVGKPGMQDAVAVEARERHQVEHQRVHCTKAAAAIACCSMAASAEQSR